MNTLVAPPDFRAVSSALGREICRPIDSLRANLVRLLEDPIRPPSEAERTHAATMLILCDELNRLTREYLGTEATTPVSSGPAGRSDG